MNKLAKKNMILILIILSIFSSCHRDSSVSLKEDKHITLLTSLQTGYFNLKLPFGFNYPLSQCYLSDYELIAQDALLNKQQKILISIEKLDHPQKVFAQQTVDSAKYSFDQFTTSFGSRFFNNNGIYGVYLCSDKESKKSCGTKDFYTYEDLTYYLFSNTSNKSEISHDKIFYFKPILILNENVYSIDFSEEKEKVLARLSEITKTNKKTLEQKLQPFIKLDEILNNHLLSSNNNNLILNLAKLDPICNKEKLLNYFQKITPKKMKSQK